MRTLLACIGLLILCYVAFGLVAGLVPVEGWSFIIDLFIEREPNTFYRVVPLENSNETAQIIALTAIGSLLIILSRAKIFKKNAQ